MYIDSLMKKMILAALLGFGMHQSSWSAIQEVAQEASGSGTSQHQAISEALLIATQAVNGTTVSQQVDYEDTVQLTMQQNHWVYTGKSSPVFSVKSTGAGSITRFQVLSVTGNQQHYQARVRAYVTKFGSSVEDQHLHRIAILPFRLTGTAHRSSEFSEELADVLGTYLSQSNQLSVVDRQYIDEMQAENDFLRWDGAPQELARIGQKVGADYLLVGKISQLGNTSSTASHLYGLNQNAQQLRLTWRVIEANTSKVVAAGTLNQVIAEHATDNLLSDEVTTPIDQVAQQLNQKILQGLKLTVPVTLPTTDPSPGYAMTPGSSEEPIRW